MFIVFPSAGAHRSEPQGLSGRILLRVISQEHGATERKYSQANKRLRNFRFFSHCETGTIISLFFRRTLHNCNLKIPKDARICPSLLHLRVSISPTFPLFLRRVVGKAAIERAGNVRDSFLSQTGKSASALDSTISRYKGSFTETQRRERK